MAPDWKLCRQCRGEFLKVVDGLCAGCSGWTPEARGIDPGASEAIVEDVEEEPQDFKSRAAGDED